MTSDSVEVGSPWYRNFWPWFIVLLLATSVVGSLVTVAIAYRHRDIDVRDVEVRGSAPVESSYPSDRGPRDRGR